MTPQTITKLRMRFLLLVLTISVVFAAYTSWLVYLKPAPVFRTLPEDVWYEYPPKDNDDFLNQLIVQRFGWHSLPAHSVQHMCFMGMLHHSERFVIRLSPEDFADLKAHIDSELIQEPKQDTDYKPAFSNDSPTNHFDWWKPPKKKVFSFSLGPDKQAEATQQSGTNDLWGGYTLEYDPETHLLYIEAGTV